MSGMGLIFSRFEVISFLKNLVKKANVITLKLQNK